MVGLRTNREKDLGRNTDDGYVGIRANETARFRDARLEACVCFYAM